MKKLILFCIIMVLALHSTASLSASAEATVKVSGDYEYTVSGNSIEITKYNGASSTVKIPSVIAGKKVTSIGNNAFSECSSMTEVYIPDTVTYIGYMAFYRCSSLKVIHNMGSVETIVVYAFAYCRSLTSVKIPSTIKDIYPYAFEGCSSLRSISISDDISVIDNMAFVGTLWYNIQPEGEVYLNTILYEYRGDCPAEIYIKEGTTGIAGGAFMEQEKLETVHLPDSLRSIGVNAFRGCSKLKSINLPDSLTYLGCYSFDDTLIYTPRDGSEVYFGKFLYKHFHPRLVIGGSYDIYVRGGTEYIVNYAFDDGYYIGNILIPRTVKSIGNSAFSTCSILDTVYFTGTKEEWDSINIESGNEPLLKAKMVYNYVPSFSTPTITSVKNETGGVKIKWEGDEGVEKFRVYRKIGSSSWDRIGTTYSSEYTDTTAVSGKTYTYTVRCITDNEKAFTSEYDKTGKTITFISAPVVTKLECTETGVKLKWNKVAGATQYRVYIKTGSGWKGIDNTKSTEYTHKDAVKGKTYTYTVRCISSDSNSATSSYYPDGWSIKYIYPIIVSPKLGDADGSGGVDATDATIVSRAVIKKNVPYGEKTLMNADVDGDGNLTIVDATFIQRYCAKVATPYKIGKAIER